MSSSARHALISVSDKTDLETLARGLHGAGYVLVSTGGSKAAIAGYGIPVKGVEELTGFPEMMDGRVKTLHPGVHGGLLARRDDESHMAAAASQNISMIDVLVVNLYPFRATVTKADVSYAEGVENIDIGGPAMIRAAAKNHAHVSVVVDPSDYADFLAQVAQEGGVSLEKRGYLAWKAFQHCSSYDALVSEWLWGQVCGRSMAGCWEEHRRDSMYPSTHPPISLELSLFETKRNEWQVGNGAMQPEVTVPMRLKEVTRYGENSHQKAAIYSDESLREHGAGGVGSATQHHGKEMSYNNYLDAEAAFSMASDFKDPCCVIVKHTNSCGVSVVKEGERDLLEAYRCAVRADPISAFGGIVAFNTTIDEDMAREIREFRSPTDGETRMFYEIVIAPGYTEKGLEVLKGKSKTLRILEAKLRAPSGIGFRQVSSGWLSQEADSLTPEDIEFTCVSEAQPTPAQLDDLNVCMALRQAREEQRHHDCQGRQVAWHGKRAAEQGQVGGDLD